MPAFGVSWKDPAVNNNLDIAIDGNCNIFTFEDHANYAANTDNGHELADFTDFRKVVLINPAGTETVFSTTIVAAATDIIIPAASTGNQVFNHTLDENDDKDGVYEFQLYSVPTYDAAESYSQDDHIFNVSDKKLYKSLVNTNLNNTPDTSPTQWEEVPDFKDLPVRYCTIEKVALTCRELQACYERLTHAAVCVIHEDFCNPDFLCKNKSFLNAITLRLLFDNITYSVNNKQFDQVTNDINLAKKICNCS